MALSATNGVSASPAEQSAAQQQSQSGPSAGGGGSLVRPDPRHLSQDARDVLETETEVRKLIDGKYKDPDAAYAKLWQLDKEGQDQLRGNPEMLGELKPGVDRESVDTESLAEFSHSFEYVKPEIRQEVSGHKQGMAQYESRMQQEQEAAMAKTPEARANESLGGAMSISHHASI